MTDGPGCREDECFGFAVHVVEPDFAVPVPGSDALAVRGDADRVGEAQAAREHVAAGLIQITRQQTSIGVVKSMPVCFICGNTVVFKQIVDDSSICAPTEGDLFWMFDIKLG